MIKSKEKLKEEIEEIIGKGEINNFKKFAFKGKMIEMSIAFILGAYFQKAVEGISNHLIMPIINFALMTTGSDWRTIVWSPITGMTFEIGQFMGIFFDFFLTAIILYIIFHKVIPRIFQNQITNLEQNSKDCPKCLCKIDQRASRCNFCTSWIEQ